MRYSDFEAEFLVAAYKESSATSHTSIRSGILLESYPLRWQPGWVHQLVSDLGTRGLLRGKGVMGDENQQPIMLTAAGMKAAEELIDRGYNIEKLFPDAPVQVKDATIPASDRVVSLSHNQIAEIESPINAVITALDQDNGLPEEPTFRQRMLGQIKAGKELLKAGEFKIALLQTTLVAALGEIIARYKEGVLVGLATNLLQYLLTNGLSG